MSSKRLFILGGTGPLGIFVCHEAVKRGHSITIYARNPSKVPKELAEHEHVKVVEGEINDETLLSESIRSHDIVFSALGPATSSMLTTIVSGISPGTFTNAYRIVFDSMRKAGISRIFAMGTPSIQTEDDQRTIAAKFAVGILRMVVNSAYTEIVAVGKLFDQEAQDLEWTIYRVGNLSDGAGSIKVVKSVGMDDWNLKTHRPGLAQWLLDQIEKTEAECVRQKPAVYSV